MIIFSMLLTMMALSSSKPFLRACALDVAMPIPSIKESTRQVIISARGGIVRVKYAGNFTSPASITSRLSLSRREGNQALENP